MNKFEQSLFDFAYSLYDRVFELVYAPFNNQSMLWTAIPLLIATIFMMLYFGRYRKEELGWNTAFSNTAIFLFVAINIIREMYSLGGGSWETVFSNSFHMTVIIGLIIGAIILMFITYFHLLPKRIAFFLFSAVPINVAVYTVMALIYADVAADEITFFASLVFLLLLVIVSKIVKVFLVLIGFDYIPQTIGLSENNKSYANKLKKEKLPDNQEEKPNRVNSQ